MLFVFLTQPLTAWAASIEHAAPTGRATPAERSVQHAAQGQYRPQFWRTLVTTQRELDKAFAPAPPASSNPQESALIQAAVVPLQPEPQVTPGAGLGVPEPTVSFCQGQWCTNTNQAAYPVVIKPNETISLTSASQFGRAASAWRKTPLDLRQSFTKNFGVYLGDAHQDDNGADGLVFVLQSSGLNALGGVGLNIGYGGMSGRSLGVEIDTWKNYPGQCDPNLLADHLAINENGAMNNCALPQTVLAENIEDGQIHQLKIVWNAPTQQLKVYWDKQLKITYTRDLVNAVFNGTPTVYYGFTAGTGANTNEQYFYELMPLGRRSRYSSGSGQSSIGGPGDPRECPCQTFSNTQGTAGDPINTQTGGFDFGTVDLSIPTVGGPLVFQRSYSSLAIDQYTTTLGYGWTHNHDTRLIFSDQPGGEPGMVWFKAHSANQYAFFDNGDETFTPYAGVLATLVRHAGPLPGALSGNMLLPGNVPLPYYYVVTTPNQAQYIFDAAGRLLLWRDAQGHGFGYTYTNGVLTRMVEETGLRYLDFHYANPAFPARLTAVSDHTGRSVSFNYNAEGDLVSQMDVLGQTWTYHYVLQAAPTPQSFAEFQQTLTGGQTPPDPEYSSHYLAQVTAPDNTAVVRTSYDLALGKAIQQWDATGRLVLEIAYLPEGRTIITDAQDISQTHIYDERGTLVNTEQSLDSATGKAYNAQFRSEAFTDPLSHTTNLTWDENGLNLTQVTDALGQSSHLHYDALNNVTQTVDARGAPTHYAYYPDTTLLMTMSTASGETTAYTYTLPGGVEPSGLLREQRDPRGVATRYSYNQWGQVVVVTANYVDGVYDPAYPAEDLRTQYVYDDLGRRIKTITAVGTTQERTDATCYDNAGRVTRTIQNISVYLTNECAPTRPTPSAEVAYDRMTDMVYNVNGLVIATIDPLGKITRTWYDANQRPVTVVVNLDPAWGLTNPLAPARSDDPQVNLRSDTYYDASGRLIASMDALGRVARTWYDALGRAVTTTQNLVVRDAAGDPVPVEAALLLANPPTYDAARPAENISNFTAYDAAGNVLWTMDNSGRVSVTCYDALNRPVKSIQNPSLVPTDPALCASYLPSGAVDEDVVSLSFYDPNGNVTATVTLDGAPVPTPNGKIMRTWYDALNRPVTVTQNLVVRDAMGEPWPWAVVLEQWAFLTTPPVYDPTHPDENLSTVTHYDDAGRAFETVDLSTRRVDRTFYDALGRTTAQVQNYTSDIGPRSNTLNLSTSFRYDDAGRQIATTAPDGQVTRQYYNAGGQRIATVVNLKNWPITDPNLPPVELRTATENMVALVTYDRLGRVVSTTTAAGTTWQRVDVTCYDAVGRVVRTVANVTVAGDACQDPGPHNAPDENIVNSTVYDAGGQALAQIDAAGHIHRTYYDGLGRAVVTVANLVGQPIADPNPPSYDPQYPDRNVRQTTHYNAAGQPDRTVDNAGLATCTTYDLLGRVVEVAVNCAFGSAAPLSSRTYYDRQGNVRQQVNADDVATVFEYDQLGRLTAVIENYRAPYLPTATENVRTEYTYDAHGNRLTIRDANAVSASGGASAFAYDALDRLISETDPLGHTTTYTYTATSLRASLIDANGQATGYTYDSLRRLQAIDYPSDTADVAFTYDALGRRLTMTDGAGQTAWSYDALGRPLVITDPFFRAVNYTYNVQGQRTSLRYPDGQRVHYAYDALGRLTEVSTENWSVPHAAAYAYNAAGQLASATFGNGLRTDYTYDAFHRLTEIVHAPALVNRENIIARYQYELDAVGNRTAVTETVLDAGASDLLFAAEKSLTELGLAAWDVAQTDGGDLMAAPIAGDASLVAQVDDTHPVFVQDDTPAAEKRYRARFEFDPNTIAMAEGDTHVIFSGSEISGSTVLRIELRRANGSYELRTGALTDSGAWANTAWFSITDAPHTLEFDWQAAQDAVQGKLAFWLDGEERGEATNLDNADQQIDTVKLGVVEGVDVTTQGAEVFDAFESRTETYIGAVEGDPPTPPAFVIRYAYDALNRLTSATYSDGPVFAYTYDAVGNRLTEESRMGTNTYAYDAANRLVQVNEQEYQWDDNGNLSHDGANAYTYDAANRLLTVRGLNTGTLSQYLYNGVGDRVKQTVNGVGTLYLLDLNAGLTQVLADGDQLYLYGLTRLAQERPGDASAYYLPDALGSVRQLVTWKGELVLSQRYAPYGPVLDSAGAGSSIFQFTGEQFDDATGLTYLRARYYAGGVGRFMTKDTWAGNYNRPLSLNKWMYVEGNPINLVDPTGLRPDCRDLGPEEEEECLNDWTVILESGLTSKQTQVFLCPPAEGINNTEVRKLGVSLTSEDLDIMALLVYGESSSGNVPLEVSELKAWSFLNRLSHYWYNLSVSHTKSIYSVWRGAEKGLIVPYYTGDTPTAINNRARIAAALGVTPPNSAPDGDEAAERATLVWFATYYKTVAHPHYLKIRTSVDKIYNQWVTHGTNSSVDPIHGSVAFSDISTSDNVDKTDYQAVVALRKRRIQAYNTMQSLHPNFNYFITGIYILGRDPNTGKTMYNFTTLGGCPPYGLSQPVCPKS